MNGIIIKKVTQKELDQLQEIGKLTFFETFSGDNSEKNMREYLEENFSRENLSAELSNPGSVFYFATLDQSIIGYLKVNTGSAQTVLKDNNTIEIERIYVLKTYYGYGVGQLLYEKAIQIAKDKNADFVWLGVWEKNPRAMRFYKKNGFVEFDSHVFKVGDDEQKDIMMKLELSHNIK